MLEEPHKEAPMGHYNNSLIYVTHGDFGQHSNASNKPLLPTFTFRNTKCMSYLAIIRILPGKFNDHFVLCESLEDAHVSFTKASLKEWLNSRRCGNNLGSPNRSAEIAAIEGVKSAAAEALCNGSCLKDTSVR